VGGGSRIAGFLLAVATAVLLVIGTGPIAYIRELVFYSKLTLRVFNSSILLNSCNARGFFDLCFGH
jgi:hypothetical protein